MNELFTIFGKQVSYYGTIIALGLVGAIMIVEYLGAWRGMARKSIDFFEIMALVAIATGFGSAFLFQSFYFWVESGFTDFSDHGITFLGGLIGGIVIYLLGVFFLAPDVVKRDFPKLLETAPLAVLFAHGLGRIGCFVGGCCYGQEWEHGVQYEHLAHKVVPTNLYEALFLLGVFAILLFLVLKYDFKYCLISYLISYGIWRFVIEYFRTDARGELLGFMTPSQTWSLLMVIGGVAWIILIVIKKSKPQPKLLDENKLLRSIKKPLYI